MQESKQEDKQQNLFLNIKQNQNEEEFQDTGKFSCYENTLSCFGSIAGCLGMWLPFPCCCCPKPIIKVKQSYFGLLEKFGRYQKTLTAGLHKVNPYCEKIKLVDSRTYVNMKININYNYIIKVLDLKRQSVMTNDNISVNIDSVIFYRIYDPKKAMYKLSDIKASIEGLFCFFFFFNKNKYLNKELTYTCLRTICGEHSFQDLLEKRDVINDQIEAFIEQQSSNWGIYVEQVFIKDMLLSKDLMNQMSLVPISLRKAETKIISSQADVESAKLFREAADMLSSNAAMQIRYFELIQQIADQKGKSVVFLPLKQQESQN
ncbi:stomatin family protein, putative [Ichthyophthirius multifiliis]|uniref:Stomatin family protein, putative n=1 Tax=Ichthyophthirius multifiliis TaxID=5932 RepID=G0R308_ICHMU|nr:stomatin family protein, putative [Ichthyophthirius multifiliis]EGR28140.1 stomatin family protein, putative [Ichthyophthirius multifiliis]|eukprot:XP_004027485.1 stomatin family protein, putative [Ichthyophthirius multifiliis]